MKLKDSIKTSILKEQNDQTKEIIKMLINIFNYSMTDVDSYNELTEDEHRIIMITPTLFDKIME